MLIVLLFCTFELLNNIVVHESLVHDRTIRTQALRGVRSAARWLAVSVCSPQRPSTSSPSMSGPAVKCVVIMQARVCLRDVFSYTSECYLVGDFTLTMMASYIDMQFLIPLANGYKL